MIYRVNLIISYISYTTPGSCSNSPLFLMISYLLSPYIFLHSQTEGRNDTKREIKLFLSHFAYTSYKHNWYVHCQQFTLYIVSSELHV